MPPPPEHRWVLTSPLQKSIGRGRPDHAVKYATLLYGLDPYYYFRRLSIIALEDVGPGGPPFLSFLRMAGRPFFDPIDRGRVGAATNPAVFFDNDHDLAREAGDDGFGMSVDEFTPAGFFDTFVDGSGNTVFDTSDGGTVDGATAAKADGSSTYIEMSHPLDSLDDAHDFSLSGGEVLGFGVLMNLFGLDASCTPNSIGPPCQVFTHLVGSFTDPSGDIFVLSPSPGLCERSALDARNIFVATCIAAGGSSGSCNRLGSEIIVRRLEECRAP